jgi:hypothetical protein
MDRGEALLFDLRNKLESRWAETIRRATGATLTFAGLPGGEFVVKCSWGEAKTYEKTFTRERVFGGSYNNGVQGWHVERRACDHARDLIRELLVERGVL